jgi:hypothetical protein
MDCYCDYEAPEFIIERLPRAKKTYKCYECGASINPGDQYEYTAGKWEGEFMAFKICMDCRTVREAFDEMKCFCWSYGGLWEDIRDLFASAYFSPGARFAYLRVIAKHPKVRRKRAAR